MEPIEQRIPAYALLYIFLAFLFFCAVDTAREIERDAERKTARVEARNELFAMARNDEYVDMLVGCLNGEPIVLKTGFVQCYHTEVFKWPKR